MMEKALIQVVEDNRIIALGIQSTLNSQGYDVSSVVSSGEEAVKKAEEDNPDLVLMDIVLEGEMDGIEAAEQIRSRFNIPVVFLTAYTDEKKLERAKLTEPFGYIIKPFEDRELHFIIEIALFRYKIERRLKESEEQLKASLKEKEALLKEIHHRVKNNMQIIHSLLNIQSRQIKDKDILNMLKETQHRVRSMALIHEKLYQSKDLSKIEFGDYIRKLVFDLFHMYGVDSNSIKLKINVENVYLDINAAIPCGLIINELVSNSLKHAFPEGKVWGERGCTKGKIHIRLSSDKNNKYTLIVCDNGVGFPEDLDFRKTESLGMQLVNILVEQLEGNIELRRKDGTTFKITFK